MVEPGASAEEIRSEIYDGFSSRLQERDIDEDIVDLIEAAVTAQDPPHEFSEDLLEEI